MLPAVLPRTPVDREIAQLPRAITPPPTSRCARNSGRARVQLTLLAGRRFGAESSSEPPRMGGTRHRRAADVTRLLAVGE